jgi:hypothetical protein
MLQQRTIRRTGPVTSAIDLCGGGSADRVALRVLTRMTVVSCSALRR